MQLSSSYTIHCKLYNKISNKLQHNSTSDHGRTNFGLPTCLAISNKFIGIGTQTWIILIYDLFEQPRQQLSLESSDVANTHVAVTSIDISFNSDTVITGYTSGIIELRDLLNGIVI